METLSERSEKNWASPEEIKSVMEDIKALLHKIEDVPLPPPSPCERMADVNACWYKAVPFINLAVTTSGVNISSTIPQNVSPSRLLMASGMLSAGDTAYCYDPFKPAQIGQTFWLTLYMLFAGHSHRQELVSAKDLTWQEVMYKCRVNLQRVPLFYDEEEGEAAGDKHLRAQSKMHEYCYELSLVEDLDDGRVHDGDPQPYEDVAAAGLRTRIPVHQISKMFYTTSGKLLGIEDSKSPVLLIKRNVHALAPRKILEKVRGYTYDDDLGSDAHDDRDAHDDGQAHERREERFPSAVHAASPTSPLSPTSPTAAAAAAAPDLPKHLDSEWLAFEIFSDQPASGASSATVSVASSAASSRPATPIPDSSPPLEPGNPGSSGSVGPALHSLGPALQNLGLAAGTSLVVRRAAVRSDLSILECLLRLTILQNFQQAQHTTVHDELLNLFLSDAVWGGSKEERRLEREQARSKLGFDPFEATPGIDRHALARAGRSPAAQDSSPHSSRAGTPRLRLPEADPMLPSTPAAAGLDVGRRGDRWVRWESTPPARRPREWTPDKQLGEGWIGESPRSPLGR